MPTPSFHRRTASRGIALATFAAVLLLNCTIYPAIWHLTTNNPNPSLDPGLALMMTLLLSCLFTMLGTIGYAIALRRSSGIAYPARWRLYTLSAVLGIASPLACFALAWCARRLPVVHLSDTNTVRFLLACSLLIPGLLGIALLRFSLRKAWLYPPHTPGQCLNCRYNLTGNTSGTCPECGTSIPGSPANRPLITTWPPRPRTARR